jgi:hypothetical protein
MYAGGGFSWFHRCKGSVSDGRNADSGKSKLHHVVECFVGQVCNPAVATPLASNTTRSCDSVYRRPAGTVIDLPDLMSSNDVPHPAEGHSCFRARALEYHKRRPSRRVLQLREQM